MYQKLGYYLQMVAAFLLLALTHYFAAGFLPIADCDETFNFIEPIHYLLYGSGKQTWELCEQYALRSWLFSWMYAWPAVFIRGAASLSSADVYFYLRIFNGRIAGLAELFFVYSVWSAFSGKAAMVALLLLLVNYPIPHAAVSVLPTSFVMICNFMVLGCWLRTRAWTSATAFKKAQTISAAASGGGTAVSIAAPIRAPRHLRWSIGLALFFSVFGGITGWPFAGLVSVPIGLDLLYRFPRQTVSYIALSALVVIAAGLLVDAHYYCRWTLSGWNVVLYNVFGGAERGPELFDVEPWFFFWKNLTLNFHLMFVAVLLAPLVVLCTPRRSSPVALHNNNSNSNSNYHVHSNVSHSNGSSSGGGGVVSSFSASDSLRRFASNEDVRGSLHAPASPISPLTRSRLHPVGTPDRHSPLLGTRHAHLPASAHPSVGAASTHGGFSRGRELLYMSPFFVWFVFWMCIAHKEERFMSPAYPFMVLAATRAICFVFFPEGDVEGVASTPTAKATRFTASMGASPFPPSSPTLTPHPQPAPRTISPHGLFASPNARKTRRALGYAFLFLFFLLSYSRAMAIYTFYSGPERIFYDWYPVLQLEGQRRWAEKQAAALARQEKSDVNGRESGNLQQRRELDAYFTVCLGREWYRFPSSFFLDHRWTRYQFLNTSYFHGMLPVSFITPAVGYESGFLWSPPVDGAPVEGRSRVHEHEYRLHGGKAQQGSCTCGAAHVNDLNQEITEQYVPDPVAQCDVVFDSLSPPQHVGAVVHARERAERHLDTVFTRSLLNTSAMRAALAASGEVYRAVDDAYAVLDVDRTPLWCRVLYYPFGISRRCAAWRPLVLNAKL